MNQETNTINDLRQQVSNQTRLIESQSDSLRSAWAQRRWALEQLKQACDIISRLGMDFEPMKFEPAEMIDLLDLATEFQLTPEISIIKFREKGWAIASKKSGCYCEHGWAESEFHPGRVMLFPTQFAALAYFKQHPEIFLPNSAPPEISANSAIDIMHS